MLRILLADDHDLLRRGLQSILKVRTGWEVVGEAATGGEAVRQALALKPDVVIMDIRMPELDGLAAARQIREKLPKTEILILSVFYTDKLIQEIVKSGIRGFLLKSDSDHDLIPAVEALAAHRPFFTSDAAEQLREQFGASLREIGDGKKALKDRLTEREQEVVRLIADGLSTKDLSDRLNITPKTVDTHRANIMRKLNVHSVSNLVRYALRNEMVAAE